MQFTPEELKEWESRGITRDQLHKHVETFQQGFPAIHLERACTRGDGIQQLTPVQQEELLQQYDHALNGISTLQFVPASGAATRMFKHLHGYRSAQPDPLCLQLIEYLNRMPFYERLEETMMASNEPLDRMLSAQNYATIFHYILSQEGLGYGSLPKALIDFHRYDQSTRKSLEEHLVEAAHLGGTDSNRCRLHFTVSPEHLEGVQKRVEAVRPHYEQRFGVTYEITYSTQKTATDTLAVDLSNQPFRKEDGQLFLRPGGHGALIENLNDLDAELVFIKNIDNVVREEHQPVIWHSRKVLAAYLLQVREAIHKAIARLREGAEIGPIQVQAREQWSLDVPEQVSREELIDLLNRPIRVGGMVRNEGQPGGGPFWVRKNGQVSLQIVEKAQIDLSDPKQAALLEQSTHFNPVDLVCWLKDADGQPFDLLKYRDDETGFISEKSWNGRPLKALELPGLWNGAMAHWITLFVEVPQATFNPVKTVNDLLNSSHQPA